VHSEALRSQDNMIPCWWKLVQYVSGIMMKR